MLTPTSSYTKHPLLQALLAISSPDLGGKAKNHSRRKTDAETGEPRALHLPHSNRTTARELLLHLWVLILTENSKLIFTSDLQILRRRKRNKKQTGHLLEVSAAEERAPSSDSPGRALIQLSG